MNIIKLLIIILVIYILLQGVSIYKEKRAVKQFSYGKFPLIFAHRGSSHLYPENTQLAFEKSFEMGVDAFETDIRLTKDGEIITHHNENIDETADGSGNVIDYTLEEIMQFNFGSKFKNLNGEYPYREKINGLNPMEVRDFFSKFSDKVLYSIDIKDNGENGKKSAELLYKYVKEYHLENNVIFVSFYDENLDYLRKISKNDIIISASSKKATNIILSSYIGYDFLLKYNTSGLQIPTSYKKIPLDTKYLIYKAHKHNMFVHYWTINTKEEMESLINKKVDAITTDRVDIMLNLKEVCNEKA